MVNAKDSKTGSARFATPLKVAVWVAVLGFIMLAVETPYWVTPTDTQHAAATSTPASPPQDIDLLVDSVLRPFAAQARLLYAAEGRDLGGDQAGVDADHAVLERLGDAPDAADVARVEVRRQAE